MPKKESIGALWEKRSKSGNNFLSGNIVIAGKKYLIVAFYNDRKEGNQPDFRIYESEDRGFSDRGREDSRPRYRVVAPPNMETNSASSEDMPEIQFPELESDKDEVPF